MTGSIHGRLLLAATLVLVAFLGLGAFALDRAFRDSLDQATESRLLTQIYGLLAAATEDEQGRIALPKVFPDPRYARPDSGLYAQAISAEANYRWRSISLLGQVLEFPDVAVAGTPLFRISEQANRRYYQLSYRVLWADSADQEISYLFSVAEDASEIEAQVAAFRRTLIFWLGGVSLLLLFGQGVVLSWGLRPLRDVADDLQQIESGQAEQLLGEYPRELTGLTHRINSLIQSGRASQERYRNSLGDLAHSLKTPLAVLQGAAEQDSAKLKQAVNEQVPRMNDIVQYQLKRAATSGFTGVQQAIEIRPLVSKLVVTLDKVYRDKEVKIEITGSETAKFRGDRGDLLECLGNILENAYKYCQQKVAINIDEQDHRLIIRVEDDGPGIGADLRAKVLKRGERADQRQSGQGIGLSVANEIVRIYGGELQLSESLLGGVLLKIIIPTH